MYRETHDHVNSYFFSKLEENSPRQPYAAEDRVNPGSNCFLLVVKVKTSARSEFRVTPYLCLLKSTSTGMITTQVKGNSFHPREAWSSFFPCCFLYLGALFNWKNVRGKEESTTKTLQTKMRKGIRRTLTALHDTHVRASFLVQSIARTSSCPSHYIQVSARNHWQDYLSKSYTLTQHETWKREQSPVHGLKNPFGILQKLETAWFFTARPYKRRPQSSVSPLCPQNRLGNVVNR